MTPPPAMLRSPRHRAAAALLSLILAGCIHAPEATDQGALSSARSLLAREFGPAVTEARLKQIAALPRALAGELGRPASWRIGSAATYDELRRSQRIASRLRGGATTELARRPKLNAALPDLHAFEQDIADDLDLSMKLLGTSLRPLGEISDRRHRTDPANDRPEATFWQRLRRRLRL